MLAVGGADSNVILLHIVDMVKTAFPARMPATAAAGTNGHTRSMHPRNPALPATDPDRDRQLPALPGTHAETDRVTRAILDFVAAIPPSGERAGAVPHERSRQLATAAARRAALTAGTLALPPGPLGWLTVLPELVTIWKIQAQLVSDIAAAHGRHLELGREQMLYCLFRHTAAQALRDLAVRMGDRVLFQRMSQTLVEQVARQLGLRFSRRMLGAGAARWLPVVGAAGVGAYAYYDTTQVAKTALALFAGDIETASQPPQRGVTPAE